MYLENGGESGAFNLGNGSGYSVREIIETAKLVTKMDIPVVVEPRRPGDPSTLIASNEKAKTVLGWRPIWPLSSIIYDAWVWHSQHPNGFGVK